MTIQLETSQRLLTGRQILGKVWQRLPVARASGRAAFWASPRPVDLPSMGSLGEAVLRRQRQLQEALRALLSDAEQAQAPLADFHPIFQNFGNFWRARSRLYRSNRCM